MLTLKDIREKRRLQAVETAARFTQEALAAEMGISVPTLKKYEENPLLMTIEQLRKACDYLGCDADIFLKNEPN